MLRFYSSLALAFALMFVTSALAVEAFEQAPKFNPVSQRLQSNFGLSLKLAQIDDSLFAKNYVVSPLKLEHLDHALQILS